MKLFEYLFGMLTALMLIVAYTIFAAWSFTLAWLWLAVPIFKVQALSIPQVILLAMFVLYLGNNYQPELKKSELKRFFLALILKPFLLLAIAFILKRFI